MSLTKPPGDPRMVSTLGAHIYIGARDDRTAPLFLHPDHVNAIQAYQNSRSSVNPSASIRCNLLPPKAQLLLTAVSSVLVLVELPHDQMHKQVDIHPDLPIREELHELGVVELRL